ncbi:MAG TPA: ABC transporter permease, partial [Chloroflexota bacterium]|nr:ABC transporter permease [Chloroflexota bacterium]
MDASSLKSARRERLRLLVRSGTFIAGFVIVAFWATCAIFGHHIAPQDPYADDLLNTLDPPSADHWFGTDQLGRDVFSRVIVGAQDILTVAPLATILGTILGAALGLVTGYFRSYVDDVISRLIDAVNALPLVIIALLALVALGSSDATV